MGLTKLPDLTEREKALKKAKDRSKREKAAKEEKKKATGDAVYKKYVNQYQREEDRTGVNKKADKFFDNVGDKVRGSAVGKFAKSRGTGTFSKDDEAQMQARKDVKGYKKGGMAKMPMMQEGGDVDKVPTKEEFDAMTPKQQADRKKAAMMQNLNLTPEEKAAKEAMEKKNMGDKPKKMNMGGMTSKMSKQKGGNTVIVDPAKKSPKSRMKTSGSGSKMAMMKEGGNIPKYKAGKKVRGYGKARGGKACKMR